MLSLILSLLSQIFHFALHINSPAIFPRPLTQKEEQELLTKMAQGDEVAKNKLIEHNLRLVSHIIKKYYATYTDQEDLLSIGTIGLIKGVNSFDSSKGTRLATYAARCIENEILMYFRSQKKNSIVTSINEPIESDSDGNPLTMMDVLYAEDTVADDIDLKIKSEKLYFLVESIEDEREKEIIIKRYGLYNSKAMTQKEIAKELNISRSYVSRIEKKVIEDLRKGFG